MKTTVNHTKNLLLLSGLLLAYPSGAMARDIPIEYVTVSVSTISPAPTEADTITIRNGGTLWVDQDATVGKITLGDAASAGIIKFDGTPRTLTVTDSGGQPGDVLLGATAGNVLDISYLGVAHTLRVAGSFVPSGKGTFIAGMGTVVYNRNGAQTVTAKIDGATIQYKNLRLSGSGVDNVKTLGDGVAVQGQLTVQGSATLAGTTPITYGSLASLLYKGSSAQTASGLEFLPEMPVPVIIENSAGVTLNSDKMILTPDPIKVVLTVVSGCKLYDGGKTLTVHGNIQNDGAHSGTGKIVLGGSVAQTLTGASTYGNLVLNNTEGATLKDNTTISGRLIVAAGRLNLPNKTSHTTVLLTYGGTDKAVTVPTTFGSSASDASVKDDTVFQPTFKGILTLTPKPAASIACENVTIIYGESEITVEGNVLGGDNGNVSQSGETITIAVATAIPMYKTVTTTGATPSFSAKFPTATVPVGNYDIRIGYAGGINLASVADAKVCELIVKTRLVVVQPKNVSKIYGDADPVLAYDLLDPKTQDPTVPIPVNVALVNGDELVGFLGRTAGENVGGYAINRGTLKVDPASSRPNYEIEFLTGKSLTILLKPVTVAAQAKTKTYGDLDPLPWTYTITPPLVTGDYPEGALDRDPGENVGPYQIFNPKDPIVGLHFVTPNFPGVNNYDVTYIPANLTITKKTIWVKAVAASKEYGEPDPAFTFKCPAETTIPPFTGNLTRTPGETVADSPYTILQGDLSMGPNYAITFTEAEMKITKRKVYISALKTEKVYGTDNPPFIKYDGLYVGNPLVPDQLTTATPVTIATWNPSVPTAASLPGLYTFILNQDAADPNYKPVYNVLDGELNIKKAPLTITADDKTKVANGAVFNPVNFTVNYSGFIHSLGDNPANSFLIPAILEYKGTAVTATTPGTYVIHPKGLLSDKYEITWVDGRLTITGPVQASSIPGPVAWTVGSHHDFEMNQANDGKPGAPEPEKRGWSFLTINGDLDLTALTDGSFQINPITIDPTDPNKPELGLMAKFDPTRPYSFTFLHATAINGFVASKFTISLTSFVNKWSDNIFKWGTFDIALLNDNELALTYTPLGGPSSPNPAPEYFTVGLPDDTSKLLGSVLHSDVDVLYLQPDKTAVLPYNDKVTVELKVANLQQTVVGAQAFIQYSSKFFDTTKTVIAPGGDIWSMPIVTYYYVGGELDIVMGVSTEHLNGTDENGTVAKITLVPNRTAVGKSRVVFRQDFNPADKGMAKNDQTTLLTSDNKFILPARVMTDEIVIVDDTEGPVIASISAMQWQPRQEGYPKEFYQPRSYVSVYKEVDQSVITPITVNLSGLNQTAIKATRLSASMLSAAQFYKTVRGDVEIVVEAADAGIGLRTSNPVELKLYPPKGLPISLSYSIVNNSLPGSGKFKFVWKVIEGTENGLWIACVTVYDNFPDGDSKHKITKQYFGLDVNKNEITGIVELEAYKGNQREVTFRLAPSGETMPIPLGFVYTEFMEKGAYANRYSFASSLYKALDPMSAYLRFGYISNLPEFVKLFLKERDHSLPLAPYNIFAYLQALEFGDILPWNIPSLAYRLYNPTRAIDAYVVQRVLTPATLVALQAYIDAGLSPTEAQVVKLKTALLNDFTAAVLGPNIYEQTRFETVILSPYSDLNKNKVLSGALLVELNRSLLRDAYPQYIPGKLDAKTANLLAIFDTSNANNYDTALVWQLLSDMDELITTPSLWEGAPSLYTMTRFLGVGVDLKPRTLALLEKQNRTPYELTLLNRYLLEDTFAGYFTSGLLTPQTVDVVDNYYNTPADQGLITDFETVVTANLNEIIKTKSLYEVRRFAGKSLSSEIEALRLQNPASGTPAFIELNRRLLEVFYSSLSKNVLARYIIINVPDGTTDISAKTRWNLRKILHLETAVDAAHPNGLAYFVNNGVTGYYKLPAGDMTKFGETFGDNVINLIDYNILKSNWPGKVIPPYDPLDTGYADVDGDGSVNIFDYNYLKLNFSKRGDPDVNE